MQDLIFASQATKVHYHLCILANLSISEAEILSLILKFHEFVSVKYLFTNICSCMMKTTANIYLPRSERSSQINSGKAKIGGWGLH